MAQFKSRMLWENIHKADLTAVHGLLESGNINLEERDESGHTFLMVASEKGELNIVRELLQAGCDSNAVDNENWSALLCASKEGHLEIVIELLEHGADLEHKDMWGWTALMWASYKGRIIVVQELLDRGANPNAKADHNMTSLAWAAGRGHTEIVNMLISKGAKVNTADKYGTTPLIWACRKGYIDIVDALLAEGANVDAAGMNSWSPLLVSTKGGHYDVVHALLQQDPNVNATDKDGLTPLATAAKEGYVEIVQDLISKGAYVNIVDRAGDSILIHAVKGGQVEVVRALVDKYVDVDVQGQEDKTALYWAVEKGHNEIVRLLLGSQPDMELPTKDEDTALLKAVRNRNEEIVRVLLEKGAKVSACDKRGDTALHIAIRARSKRITELLLRNPRNSRLLYRPNKAGETPYAMDTYHQRGILQGIYGHRNLNASDAENLLGYDIYSSALADILSDPSLATPITVGLYAKWGSGKSFLINKLVSEMKSFTQQSTDEHFVFTPTIVLLALFFSLIVGEALILGVSLKVGIGVCVAIFCLQLIFFGILVVCDQRYDMKAAVRMSTVLGRRQRLMMLLLRMLFCNPHPSKKKDATQYSVRFLFSDCTRLSSVGGEKALAAMIATLCQAVEREYGFLVTRLFRVFKPPDTVHNSRFKSLCCIPYFVLVLVVLACLAAGVALLVEFPLYKHIAVDSILIAIAVILTLTLVGNIYTWAQTLMALVSSQKRRILKAADNVDTLKMDGFLQCLKQEVDLMSRMVTCMDSFTSDQTRLVVIVDGLDSCEQGKVLQVLDTVKALFCDDNSPYITVLAVDPHIIIKGIEQNLKSSFQDSNVNGFDYLRNVVHLPFYLQSQGLRIQHHDSLAPNSEGERGLLERGTSVKMVNRRKKWSGHGEEDERGTSGTAVDMQESVMSTTSVDTKFAGSRRKPVRGQETLAGSQSQLAYASSFDLSNTFIRNDYFSDINPRSMRRLMNIVSVTARLLRAYNIDFKWHRLAAWINIIEQWPYRVSWIIYYFEEADVLDNGTTLFTLYQRVQPRIPVSKELEPLLEIDRNARKLEAFLSNQSASLPRLNVGDLRRFLPCCINLDPYLRKLIRETEHQNEMMRQEMSAMGFPSAPPPPFSPPVGTSVSVSNSTLDTSSGVSSWVRPPAPQMPPSFIRPQLPRPPSGIFHGGNAVYPGFPGASGVYPASLAGFSGLLSQAPANTSSHLAASQYTTPVRPHPAVFFDNARELKNWTERDVEGVCSLVASLRGVTPDVIDPYTQRVRENNISGLVLQACDLEELRPVLQMRFGDWQLFKAAILSLREWDGAMMGPDYQPSPASSNNSASVPNTTTTTEIRDTGARAKDVPVSRHQQGHVVGPKGRRMRRNDSIVQQLSYEAAILHEALEEFSEDSEGAEDDLTSRDAAMQDAMGKEEISEQTTTTTSLTEQVSTTATALADDPLQPHQPHPHSVITSVIINHPQLREMITVLDSPPMTDEPVGRRSSQDGMGTFPDGRRNSQDGTGTFPEGRRSSHDGTGNFLDIKTAQEFSPFLLQQSFPSGARLSDVSEEGPEGQGSVEESQQVDMPDSASFSKMLSRQQSNMDAPKETETKSPWDREAFAPESSASQRRVSFSGDSEEIRRPYDRRDSYGFTATRQATSPDQEEDLGERDREALVDVSHDSNRPTFHIGSPTTSTTLTPAFTIENEMAGSSQSEAGQGAGPWQMQGRVSMETFVMSKDKGDPDDDRESIV